MSLPNTVARAALTARLLAPVVAALGVVSRSTGRRLAPSPVLFEDTDEPSAPPDLPAVEQQGQDSSRPRAIRASTPQHRHEPSAIPDRERTADEVPPEASSAARTSARDGETPEPSPSDRGLPMLRRRVAPGRPAGHELRLPRPAAVTAAAPSSAAPSRGQASVRADAAMQQFDPPDGAPTLRAKVDATQTAASAIEPRPQAGIEIPAEALAIRATGFGVSTPQSRHEPSPVPDRERRTQETGSLSRTSVRDGEPRPQAGIEIPAEALAIRATGFGVSTPQDRHEPSPVPDHERRTQETIKPSRSQVRDGAPPLAVTDGQPGALVPTFAPSRGQAPVRANAAMQQFTPPDGQPRVLAPTFLTSSAPVSPPTGELSAGAAPSSVHSPRVVALDARASRAQSETSAASPRAEPGETREGDALSPQAHGTLSLPVTDAARRLRPLLNVGSTPNEPEAREARASAPGQAATPNQATAPDQITTQTPWPAPLVWADRAPSPPAPARATLETAQPAEATAMAATAAIHPPRGVLPLRPPSATQARPPEALAPPPSTSSPVHVATQHSTPSLPRPRPPTPEAEPLLEALLSDPAFADLVEDIVGARLRLAARAEGLEV